MQGNMYNITNFNCCQNVWSESKNEKTIPGCGRFDYKASLDSLKYQSHENISFKWVECSTSGSKTSSVEAQIVSILGFAIWPLLQLLNFALVALKAFMDNT